MPRKCRQNDHHRVYKKDIGRNKVYEVYYCVDCGYYTPTATHKTFRCWNCFGEFMATPEHLHFVKLRCCSKAEAQQKKVERTKKAAEDAGGINNLIDDIMEG